MFLLRIFVLFSIFLNMAVFAGASESELVREIKEKVQPGDIILSRMVRPISSLMARSFGNQKYAHASLVIEKNKDGDLLAVSMEEAGVLIKNLSKLNGWSHHLQIIRPHGKPSPGCFAKAKKNRSVVYDFDLDSSEKKRLFCVEIIRFCYEKEFQKMFQDFAVEPTGMELLNLREAGFDAKTRIVTADMVLEIPHDEVMSFTLPHDVELERKYLHYADDLWSKFKRFPVKKNVLRNSVVESSWLARRLILNLYPPGWKFPAGFPVDRGLRFEKLTETLRTAVEKDSSEPYDAFFNFDLDPFVENVP